MGLRESTEAARATIGNGSADDYVISPVSHEELYRDKAPDLVAILQTTAVKELADEYERRDGKALEAQRVFLSNAKLANFTVLLTGAFSAVLLGAALFGENYAWLLGIAAGASVLAGALASVFLTRIQQGKLLTRWMNRRAQAETCRLRYFKTVTKPTGNGELNLIQLEYFLRYQFEVQRNYYESRGRDHEKAADLNLWISSLAVGLGAMASGVAGVLAAVKDSSLAALAGIGVLGSALAAYGSARESISQDRRNGERYERTRTALDALARTLDDVRQAAYQGNSKAIPSFVEAVHEQLSLEHRQWLDSAQSTEQGLARLRETLEQTQSEAGSK